jgi:hypothetical protein
MAAAATMERKVDNGSSAKTAEASPVSEMCIIDIGEHGRRAVKRLRKGEGKLMDKVEDAILGLREEGVIGSGATQTVVVVVREEASLRDLLDYGDDEDDDDDDDDED